MKITLATLFRKSIELGDEVYSVNQKSTNWIGNDPATEQEIEEAEQRLGVRFPEDYRMMLLIANGFPTSSYNVEPSFQKVNEVDFYRNYKWNVIQTWKEVGGLDDTIEELERAILIAGMENEQQFLIIPPADDKGEWKYWKFAMWIPGEEAYENLEDYFKFVIDFLEDSRGPLI